MDFGATALKQFPWSQMTGSRSTHPQNGPVWLFTSSLVTYFPSFSDMKVICLFPPFSSTSQSYLPFTPLLASPLFICVLSLNLSHNSNFYETQHRPPRFCEDLSILTTAKVKPTCFPRRRKAVRENFEQVKSSESKEIFHFYVEERKRLLASL